MNESYLSGAGCVIKVAKGRDSSAYQIDGWDIAGRITSGALVTIDSIDVSEADIAIPVVATDDFRILYRFGQSFGTLRVVGTIYLGPVTAGNKAKIVEKVTAAFKKLRLSSKKSPSKVSIAEGYKCQAYFHRIAFGNPDTNFNRFGYVMEGIVAPQPKAKK